MSARLPPPIELILGSGIDSDGVLAALAKKFTMVSDPPVNGERTYLDTFDGRLRSAGLTLGWGRQHGDRHANLALSTADGLVTRAPASRSATGPGRLFAADLPPGPLHDTVAGVIEMRALTPRASVKYRQRNATVQDREAKTVVRLHFEEPVAMTARLLVSPVLGYGSAFAGVTAALRSLPGLRPAKRPLRDEAILAAGGHPAGVSAKIAVSLRPAMRADEATFALCRRLAEVVEANLAGTLAEIDTEFLHDLRVAIRRSRSVLREMKGVFPPDESRQAAADLRWIQEITGPTRDLDVQLLEWPQMVAGLPARVAADLQPLHDLLARHREEAGRTMRRQLRGPRYAEAWTTWRALLDPALHPAKDPAHDPARPQAHRPIAAVAGSRIVTVYRRMIRMGEAINDDSPPESLHDLRKRGKEYRYLLELYGSLWPSGTVTPMTTAMKGLQDVLGRFQDDEVQANYLRSLGPELLATTGDTDTLIALGLVIDRLGRDQSDARAAFAGRFTNFAARSNRNLVAATFGVRA
ncbi:MAG: hypothetical protein QOK39_1536 [Acidimicrobiaceae bacterium]|nr:hypothetical protein [Acidimicrobiaceae bacterium]